MNLMSEVAHLWPTMNWCSAFHRRAALHARAISSKALSQNAEQTSGPACIKNACAPIKTGVAQCVAFFQGRIVERIRVNVDRDD